MDRKIFEELVLKAAEKLPEEFSVENVELVVEDRPNFNQARKMRLRHPLQLLGLYEGVPRTARGSYYNMVLPDKITLFQQSIEAECQRSGKKAETVIAEVLKHEIAHHFGIGDEKLSQIEKAKRKKKF